MLRLAAGGRTVASHGHVLERSRGRASTVLGSAHVHASIANAKRFLEISKIQNMIVRKYQGSTPIQNYSKVVNTFPTMLNLQRVTYVFGLSTIVQDLLRFHLRIFRFYSKRSEIPIVLDPPEFENTNLKIRVKMLMSNSFQHV